MVLFGARMFTMVMGNDEMKYCMLMKTLTISSHGYHAAAQRITRVLTVWFPYPSSEGSGEKCPLWDTSQNLNQSVALNCPRRNLFPVSTAKRSGEILEIALKDKSFNICFLQLLEKLITFLLYSCLDQMNPSKTMRNSDNLHVVQQLPNSGA